MLQRAGFAMTAHHQESEYLPCFLVHGVCSRARNERIARPSGQTIYSLPTRASGPQQSKVPQVWRTREVEMRGIQRNNYARAPDPIRSPSKRKTNVITNRCDQPRCSEVYMSGLPYLSIASTWTTRAPNAARLSHALQARAPVLCRYRQLLICPFLRPNACRMNLGRAFVKHKSPYSEVDADFNLAAWQLSD